MSTRPFVAAAAALTLAGSALAGSAHRRRGARRQGRPQVATVAKGLVGPLSVAQAPDGTRYWADTFAGVLYKQAVGGTRQRHLQEQAARPRGRLGRRRRAPVHHRLEQQQEGLRLDPRPAGTPVQIANTYKLREVRQPRR